MHVADLADELGVSTVAVVTVCESLGIDARWAGADLSDVDAQRVRDARPVSAPPHAPQGPSAAVAPGAPGALPPGFGAPPAGPAPTSAWAGPDATGSPPAAPFGPRTSAGQALAPGVAATGTTGEAVPPWAVGSQGGPQGELGPLRPGQRGRRDPMVASGWGYWWKSIGVTVATISVVVLTALFFGALAVAGAAYSHRSGPRAA